MEAYDVAVVGAGPAGIAAAVGAARAGSRVLLVEQSSQLGGTWATVPCVNLCGLYGEDRDGNPEAANSGFPTELASALEATDPAIRPRRMGRVHVLPCRTPDVVTLFHDLLQSQPRIVVRTNSCLVGIDKTSSTITRIIIRTDGLDTTHTVQSVVDCSGSSVVGKLAGEQILPADLHSLCPAVSMRFANVQTTGFDSPATIVRILLQVSHGVRDHLLPPGLDMLAFLPTLDDGEVVCMLNAGFESAERNAIDNVEEKVRLLSIYLHKHISAFENATLISAGHTPHTRASDRTTGRYILTAKDVLSAKRFDDEAAKCAWPIEQWRTDGSTHLQYLQPGDYYGIPDEAIQAQSTQNLFLAGKCISADNDAIASARVAGCCLATGEGAGRLAHQFAERAG